MQSKFLVLKDTGGPSPAVVPADSIDKGLGFDRSALLRFFWAMSLCWEPVEDTLCDLAPPALTGVAAFPRVVKKASRGTANLKRPAT